MFAQAEELELQAQRSAGIYGRERGMSDSRPYERGRAISSHGLDPELERRLRELQVANDSQKINRQRSRSHVRAASAVGGFVDPNAPVPGPELDRHRRRSVSNLRDPYGAGPGFPVSSISGNPSPAMANNAVLIPSSQSSSVRGSPYHGPIDASPGAYYNNLPGERRRSVYGADSGLGSSGGGTGRLRAASFSQPSPGVVAKRMPSPRVDPRAIVDPRLDPRLDPALRMADPRLDAPLDHRFDAIREPPLAFSRPPNAALAYPPFEGFWIIKDVKQMLASLPELPPLPAVLVPHDMQHEEWDRYMIVSCFIPDTRLLIFAPRLIFGCNLGYHRSILGAFRHGPERKARPTLEAGKRLGRHRRVLELSVP